MLPERYDLDLPPGGGYFSIGVSKTGVGHLHREKVWKKIFNNTGGDEETFRCSKKVKKITNKYQ